MTRLSVGTDIDRLRDYAVESRAFEAAEPVDAPCRGLRRRRDVNAEARRLPAAIPAPSGAAKWLGVEDRGPLRKADRRRPRMREFGWPAFYARGRWMNAKLQSIELETALDAQLRVRRRARTFGAVGPRSGSSMSGK